MAERILIFDGDCGFCTTVAKAIESRWRAQPIKIIPWQWAELHTYGITAEQAAARVYFVEGTEVFSGSKAITRILALSETGLWRFTAFLMTLPMLNLLAELGYRLVARYRHLLPGGTPACRVPR